ncbi:MAG TPA: hypothetical protein VIL07_06770 [Symbiobacteriaceae bacterium]
MAAVASLVVVLLSLILGWRLLSRYRQRPRPHTLWYGVGLIMTALAGLPEFWAQAFGTVPQVLWWIYWVTASALVGFLAVGTSYLLSQRFGGIALATVVALTVWLTVATLLTAGPAPAAELETAFRSAPSPEIKLPFLLMNILGSLIIFGGALYSLIRTRLLYNLWILLGTLSFSAGGAAAGLLEFPGVFAFTQMLGIILLYLGVSQSIKPRQTTSRAA